MRRDTARTKAEKAAKGPSGAATSSRAEAVASKGRVAAQRAERANSAFLGDNYIWVYIKGMTDSVGSDADNDAWGSAGPKRSKNPCLTKG